jgi:hypothetical protein
MAMIHHTLTFLVLIAALGIDAHSQPVKATSRKPLTRRRRRPRFPPSSSQIKA